MTKPKFKAGDLVEIVDDYLIFDSRLAAGTVHRVTEAGIHNFYVRIGDRVEYIPNSSAKLKMQAPGMHPFDIEDEAEKDAGRLDAEAIIAYDLERASPASPEIHSLIRLIADKPHHAPQYIDDALESMKVEARKQGQMEGPIGLFELFKTQGFLLSADLVDCSIFPSGGSVALIDSSAENGACSILTDFEWCRPSSGTKYLELRMVKVPELGCTFDYYDEALELGGGGRTEIDERAKAAWLDRMKAELL